MKTCLWAVGFFVASLLTAPAQSNLPAVRLAIVAENSAANTAADVLTAQLTTNASVVLLERNEIEKIYREQRLTADNRNYKKLGELLGADGLLGWLL